MRNPYEKYQQNTVFTAPKEDLTLMLYEGALKFANQAIYALEDKDLEKTNHLVLRVQAIIRELQLTLNMNFEISKQLAAMYDYIFELLIAGNMEKNVKKLEEARDLIRDFRDIWKEAISVNRFQQSAVPQVKDA